MSIFSRRKGRKEKEEEKRLAEYEKLKSAALEKIHHANTSSQKVIEVINERGGVAEAIYFATGGGRRGR